MERITIISDFCYPNFAGGSSKHVFDLMINFPQEKFEVKLMTREKSPDSNYLANDEQAEDHYVRMFREGRVKEFSIPAIFNPFKYIQFLKGADYVLLQYPVMGVIGGCMAKLMKKKVMYHYHGPIHIEYKYKTGKEGVRYRVLWMIQKFTAMLSDKILVHSEYMKDIAVKEHGIKESKFDTVPPYIDKTLTVDTPAESKNDNKKIKLLIPRRLTARTGVLEFLGQFLKIDERVKEKFMIYVTGCGELTSEVEKMARENPENIEYLGFVSYERLRELYGEVDSVVVPTLDLEGCGLVILEALSCGTSVLVSKTCGGGYEFVKKNVGKEYIFDVFDRKSIAEVLEFISGKPKTPEFYRNIASDFDIAKMIGHYTNNILT
ncbi:MAG: glycosyltransferase family 4 protein [Rikenellaceae bacterium]|nr:glycosyltransferase family 4 protein [Rikenellaceae bacterium]